MDVIVIIVALVFVLWLYIMLPWEMAENRERSAFFWVLISIIFSPLLSIIALWLLGPVSIPEEED